MGNGLALALIVISAITHAYWNLILKRVGSKVVGIYWAMVIAVVLCMPVFLLQVDWQEFAHIDWLTVGLSGLLKASYYVMLAFLYRTGDLSLVYPLARSAHLFVPLLAFLLLHEMVEAAALVGMTVIALGVFMLHVTDESWRSISSMVANLKDRTTLLAITTALIVALYSVIDKIGVANTSAFTFMYLMFAVTAICMTPAIVAIAPKHEVFAVLRRDWPRLTSIAALNWGGYLLVLRAMQMASVSSVVAVRQTSILFGVLMGWLSLREPLGRRRLAGATVILIGICLVSWR